jgi:rare lipoprotein A
MKYLIFIGGLMAFSVQAHATCGVASKYGNENGQSRTATGAHYNPEGYTAAHRTLAFGTRLHVVNQRNNRSVEVTINDRGPFVKGRVIDLSLGAARAIGMGGLTEVCF